MHMAGEQRIRASRQRVWEALNDPAVLTACLPGCQSLEKAGDDRFKGVIEVKIGPIGARFAGAVTLSDLDPPNGYTITGEGSGGMAGSAKGTAKVRLTADGDATVLAYEVEAQVGGRLAQLGGPVIDATAKRLAGQFFARFGEIVVGGPKAAPSAVASPVPQPAATAPHAPRGGLPVGWLLALALAVLTGFLVGRGGGEGGSDWMGLAIGLLIIVVGAAGFEFGRRSAAPLVVLDAALLARLTRGEGQ